MYKAKKIYNKKIDTKIDKITECNLNIKRGNVYLTCKKAIMGFEIDYQGKNKIESLLPNNWLLLDNGYKIIGIDFSGKGVKQSKLFAFSGNFYITKPLLISTTEEIITKCITNDKHLYKWDQSKGNQFDTSTTSWDSLKTENIHIAKKKITNELLQSVTGQDLTQYESAMSAEEATYTGPVYRSAGGK